MNWYKKVIFSSWNLKFPQEIYFQIEETVSLIIPILINLIKLPNSPIFIKKIESVNIYNNNLISSNIYLNNEFVEKENGFDVPGLRDRITGDIYLNIYKSFVYNKHSIDINYFRERLTNHIIHELSHSIDPKIVELNKVYNIYEYLKPTEFDAYSKEITESIKNAYRNKDNKEILKNWIISNSFGEPIPEIINILNMPENNYYLIQFWRNNQPTFYKKLRQRLYNEVLNESNVE